MINSMILFAFAHRSTKKDTFLLELQEEVKKKKHSDTIFHCDFTVVREVMYKYSKMSQERFLSHPIECYYFIKFAQSKKGREFIESRQAARVNNAKVVEITEELSIQAIQRLEEMTIEI